MLLPTGSSRRAVTPPERCVAARISGVPHLVRVALLTLAALAGLLAPTAAHAERWVGGDAAGDVEGWHFDPEPAPCGTYTDVDASANTNQDITGLVVNHKRREVRLVVRFADLV